jgi:hypothetical protein
VRVLAVLLPFALFTSAAPKSGEELVRQMHHRWTGRWYQTVTFRQTTTFPDRPAETWYEAGKIPGKLRIDVAPLDSMTTIVFVGDSTIVFKDGKRVAAHQDRNLLITLGFDVYGQPPESTTAQLSAAGIDMGRVREDTWQGKKVWVVGAAKGDTTTSQFWIEQERLLFVRLIEAKPSQKNPGGPPNILDVTFERYQPLGKAWIAPVCVIKLNGKEFQRESYTEIKADVNLPDELFDTGTWHKPDWIGGT